MSSSGESNVIPTTADCVLSFSRLQASTSKGSILLHSLTGYVRRGGVTAVLGQGGSGKTLLLRLLAGREPILSVAGSLICENRIVSIQGGQSLVGFVSQEDVGLVGELTPREVITFHARLGSAANQSDEFIRQIVDGVIKGLGLESVADNKIGTVLKRGLSGGEKRRVSIGAVLASRPLVICLDEATSGLDAAVAYSVIQSIKVLAQSTNVGVILTIHQPSARILTLFDDLIILDAGKAVYVGPTSLLASHFEQLGFPSPSTSTATDYVLHIVRHAPGAATQFAIGYENGGISGHIRERIGTAVSIPNENMTAAMGCAAGLWWQIVLVTHRNFVIAIRDVTLYWLQLVLALGFAFLTGAVFWSLPRSIGPRLQDQSNAIVWLTFIGTYLQVFKIYYLFSMKNRSHDERANHLYSPLAWSISDFVVTAFFTFVIYVPALLVGYGMMGLPNAAIGYIILSLFLATLAAESLLGLLCQLTSRLPTAILFGQGVLVISCVYAGGAFISWSNLGFWVWLSELSLYTFSTRGMMIVVYRHLDFMCPANLVLKGSCVYNGVTYPCETVDGTCGVTGQSVLQLFKRVPETDEWFQLGMLLVLLTGFRLLTHLFLSFPVSALIHRSQIWLTSPLKPEAQHPITPESSPPIQMNELRSPAARSSARPLTVNIKAGAGPILQFQDINLNLGTKHGKLLIDRVSGIARPGRVLAVMGPSGAGKTTLLNAISGRAPYAVISGEVKLGNEALLMRHLSYVPQFDSLNPALTVYQTFCMTALLQRRGLKDCAMAVDELLSILDLVDQRQSMVANLSSGVRKRISIGLGLLRQPRVLLLDEPTTGLDSATSMMIIEYVTRITRHSGIICMMTIHQPSAQLFQSLDDLLLLSQGRMAYYGAVSEAADYFHYLGFDPTPGSNPADLYLDLMNAKPQQVRELRRRSADLVDDTKLDWFDAFTEIRSVQQEQQNTEPNTDHDDAILLHPNERRRLYVLSLSRLVYFWQERVLYVYRLIELILVAIFIGTLFFRLQRNVDSIGEIGGALFFKVWVILFVAISGTPIMVRDRLVFENEYLNQTYNAKTYCLAYFLASLPYQLVSAIIYEAILWYLVGFNDTFANYVFSVASTFSLLLMMEGISLITVQVLKDAMLSTTFSMVVLGTLFLFPGFFVSTANMVPSIRWISYVVPTHYDLNSQMVNVFRGRQYSVEDGSTTSVSGDTILSDFYSINESYDKWLDLLIVMGYVCGFRLAHWLLIVIQYRNYGHAKSLL